MTGHTKGPWTVDDSEALKIKGADGATVASIFFTSLTRRRTSEEAHANARLIAAAPALKEALEWIDEIASVNHDQDDKLRAGGARTLRRISDRARAALRLVQDSPP